LIEKLERIIISERRTKDKKTEKEDLERSSLLVLTSNFIVP